MSLLNDIDAGQQELWDMCRKREWVIRNNKDTKATYPSSHQDPIVLLHKYLVNKFNPIGIKVFKSNGVELDFRYIILCGTHDSRFNEF